MGRVSFRSDDQFINNLRLGAPVSKAQILKSDSGILKREGQLSRNGGIGMTRPHPRLASSKYHPLVVYFGLILFISLSAVRTQASLAPLPFASKEAKPEAVHPVQGNQQIRQLEPGKPIERELAGDQSHSYQMTLVAGQYVRVVVDQHTESRGLFSAWKYDEALPVKAEPAYQRAITIREKVLEPEHPDVAASLNNLANIYYWRGDYAKAEPLLGGVHSIW
jgi:hypothetical protein